MGYTFRQNGNYGKNGTNFALRFVRYSIVIILFFLFFRPPILLPNRSIKWLITLWSLETTRSPIFAHLSNYTFLRFVRPLYTNYQPFSYTLLILHR